ncbi:protein SENSITIVITY TO RED LIGHT REDUCED 1-like isoform X3 [Solanum tuberosum]|uniref:protein SENSITIVITY TO RED LIGHT REDUCED 1-like isoform X1 n=1 Tax=Solanum tuberosum TaxID=4113 RepID=UPI0003D257C0|nr:PREDICTED: protein SENSITIVITY TO RED LIGHT REDUCED 1-like isoform X1 [Solanum tuberosum]XP_015165817.1 PREDICTED: protein SENSITIVITY TO RED LIGHT REDUCED 1-like isoform X2 [Solanum tuberosum]XP_015165818.1 PREDICTED: protein SENSITIVITY TO RED LIGHT REDUCED 1-like isoform X3 [Solanum tuberosum]
MASSAKTPALDKPNPAEDWTVVLPRRGKQKRNFHKVIIHERQKQEQLWTPSDIETNPERESKLMQKIQTCIRKLESSSFWLKFLDQLQTPEIFDRFLKAVGSEGKMQMVIYGIGSIESYEPPRLQLSLAILMKRMFSWIGEVEVFDPVISLAESRVLTALGCSVLTVNEQGRRQALRPTMFFMPHCDAELYENLLEANWRHDLLSNMTLFGNSFEAYEQHVSECKILRLADSRKHILAIRQFVKELPIDSRKQIVALRQFVKERSIDPFSDDVFRAFHGSSWHFFDIDPHSDLCDAKP